MKTLVRFASLIVAASLCAVPALSATRHFTMDDVLSAPFITALSASPDGNSLAYVADERGRRNLYLSSNGAAAKRITAYTQDDGQVISAPVIVPRNAAVAYVRNEGANDRGEDPNPLTLPDPPKQHVFIVSTAGGDPVDLGEGHSPAVSPQGDRIVWIFGGQPYTAPLTAQGTIAAGKASPLFTIRGSLDQPVFSPDGARIAFTNMRGDHGFVVIYDTRKQTIVYATPAFAYDMQPAWSPDGARVAYIRTPATLEDEDPYQDPPKEPWSIWVANASTGNAHQIFKADPGMGSEYYGTDSAAQLLWSRDSRIAFACGKGRLATSLQCERKRPFDRLRTGCASPYAGTFRS